MSNTESWDGLLKNYLKASNLEQEQEAFVCIGVNVENNEMELELERESIKYIFSLNTTNKVFLKNNGIAKPKEVIGKKLILKKVKAFNPTLRQEVDSLRIERVVIEKEE